MNNPETLHNPKAIRQDIDFYKIFKVFFSRWYWIAGCVLIALLIAKVNLIYTPNVYQTSGQIKLQEVGPTINTSGITPQNYNYTDKILAEGIVIRSSELLMNAIAKIDYKVSYFLKGRIRTSDVYPNKPFSVQILQQDSVNFSRDIYYVEAIDESTFSLVASDNPNAQKKRYRYHQSIALGNMIFKVTSAIPKNSVYGFRFNAKSDFMGRAGSINTGEAGRFTDIMTVSLADENPVFAADMLNAVMREYIKYDVVQKRRSARQMVEFIERQTRFIKNEADSAGARLANFKIRNNMIDLGSSGQMSVSKLTQFESQKAALNIEMLGIQQLEEQLNSNRSKLDINMGLEGNISGLLAGLITQYNTLIITRETKLEQLLPTAQTIKDLDEQIEAVKKSISGNITAMRLRNEKTINYLNEQIAQVNTELHQVPGKEKDYIQYQVSFDVNNKFLSLLSEKKLEAELNEAAVVSGASIVNEAFPNTSPISPQPNKVYSFAAMVGLAAGIGLILLVRFLNPYIYDKETVEALTNTPIIGVIRKFPEYIDKNSRQALSLSKPKSVFAESVRSVRTNLSFMASHKASKTICITSEISGEGKSFVTVNLASTMALIDKRVILIAADLRKSKLHKTFGSSNKVGLSTYLSGQNTLEEVLTHDEMHNIDFMPSGPVPPNPSELLHSQKMKDLLAILTPKYDYVLVDTAPVGLVSDAIPLIRQSDINIFVIRSGKSQFRAAAIPERLSREYGLNNMAIVLNAFGDDALHANYYTTDYSRGGGNSTYYYSDYSGYVGNGYYDNDPKRWWEFWKKK